MNSRNQHLHYLTYNIRRCKVFSYLLMKLKIMISVLHLIWNFLRAISLIIVNHNLLNLRFIKLLVYTYV